MTKNILDTTSEILELVRDFNLEEFELDTKNIRIRMSTVPPGARTVSTVTFDPPSETVSSLPQAEAAEEDVMEHDSYATIASPMVGTFYRRPAPDRPPYVEVGDMVKPGQPVCIIEAMKLMNEIKSDINGKIVKILVENEQPVQEGQVLFLIEPA